MWPSKWRSGASVPLSNGFDAGPIYEVPLAATNGHGNGSTPHATIPADGTAPAGVGAPRRRSGARGRRGRGPGEAGSPKARHGRAPWQTAASPVEAAVPVAATCDAPPVRLAPFLTYFALAPFIGAEEACEVATSRGRTG